MPLAGLSARFLSGVEQPVQMHDKVAHMGVVDGAVSGVLPGVIGPRIVGIDADNVERLEVAELDLAERLKLASEHEVKQLPPARLGAVLCGHAPSPHPVGNFAEVIARGLRGPCARSRADAEPFRSPLGSKNAGTRGYSGAPRRDGRGSCRPPPRRSGRG